MEELKRNAYRHVPRRLIGRPTVEAGDPAVEAAGAPLTGGHDSSDSHVGHLGQPLRGDETAALGAAAPADSAWTGGYRLPPSERRLGEGLSGDSPNLQGRPAENPLELADDQGAGGGSGL